MSVLAIAIAWLAFGALAVSLMRRRGHDAFSWAVLFLFLGPLAIPIAISSERHRPQEPPRPLPPGELDVLVAHDGSPDAHAALNFALHLLGGKATSITLAAVVDFEAPSTVRGQDTQREAQQRLDTVVSEISTRTTAPLATVILLGEPATTLLDFAVDNSYEVIVAGHRHSERLISGQRGTGGRRRSVAVLIGPAP